MHHALTTPSGAVFQPPQLEQTRQTVVHNTSGPCQHTHTYTHTSTASRGRRLPSPQAAIRALAHAIASRRARRGRPPLVRGRPGARCSARTDGAALCRKRGEGGRMRIRVCWASQGAYPGSPTLPGACGKQTGTFLGRICRRKKTSGSQFQIFRTCIAIMIPLSKKGGGSSKGRLGQGSAPGAVG